MNVFIGLMIPLIGTTLGSFCVYFLKKELSGGLQKLLLGFASGVMIAASVWSLIIPAIESNSSEIDGVIVVAIGIILGVLFLLILDNVIPHFHNNTKEKEGIASKTTKTNLLVFAVALHNIPEGMAIGVVYSSIILGNTDISLASAMALSLGIAIQNFPEGAIISMPLVQSGVSKNKAFLYGFLSGAVEPIAAIITIILANYITSLLPLFLSFAAGAMLYVVVEELIPEASVGKHSNLGTIGFSIGFIVMMVLDVVLG